MPNTSIDGAPHIRAADPADLTAIEGLLTVSGLPLDGVRDALDGFVVAQSGDDIVGVAGLETTRSCDPSPSCPSGDRTGSGARSSRA
jgi:hypothetical protein